LAVIGAGHLGRIHSRLLAGDDHADLCAIVDPVESARNAIAEEHGVRAFSNWRAVADEIDAAIIAAPTVHHAEIALGLIESGIHVLIEKPLAFSSAEANAIVSAAEKKKLVVQSGHCERFNPAFQAIRKRDPNVQLIEANRFGPYSFRSTDIGVVFDLMIHDIDLAIALVGKEVIRIDAVGGTVIGPHEDWAQARLEFADGAVAQLSACRTEIDPTRKLKVRGQGFFADADLATGELRVLTPGPALQSGFDPNALNAEEREGWKSRLFDDLLNREVVSGQGNAILEEQRDFVEAIENKHEPRAAGHWAAKAVSVAERILEQIHRSGEQPVLRKAS
jgi:predicted dehydrogenase